MLWGSRWPHLDNTCFSSVGWGWAGFGLDLKLLLACRKLMSLGSVRERAKEEGVISFFSHSPSAPSLPASIIAKNQNNSKLPQKAWGLTRMTIPLAGICNNKSPPAQFPTPTPPRHSLLLLVAGAIPSSDGSWCLAALKELAEEMLLGWVEGSSWPSLRSPRPVCLGAGLSELGRMCLRSARKSQWEQSHQKGISSGLAWRSSG